MLGLDFLLLILYFCTCPKDDNYCFLVLKVFESLFVSTLTNTWSWVVNILQIYIQTAHTVFIELCISLLLILNPLSVAPTCKAAHVLPVISYQLSAEGH